MTTNADLLTRRNGAVVRGIGHTTPLAASRARNAELWDVEGKRYVDFAGVLSQYFASEFQLPFQRSR